jgi:ABC-type proline/glycine betaine transport system permease subunit
MTEAEANDLVASRFSRMMNATTSPIGVVADPPVVAVVTAVLLVAYLAARRSDASETVQLVLLVLVALPTAAAIVVAIALMGARRRVVKWLARQPFPIENMNAILNGLGDCLEVTFRGPPPETAALNAKLDAIHTDCFVADTKEHAVLMKIGVVDDKRNPAVSNHRRYRRVVDMVERMLVTLHAEHPIESVRVQ